MKIAIVAPVIRKISSKNAYGGIERIIISIAYGAAKAGHKVTLYAPSGSDLEHENINIVHTTSQDVSGLQDLTKESENNLFKRIIKDQHNFDIIHSHVEPLIAKIDEDNNYFTNISVPLVVTMHNLTYIDENIDYYKNHNELYNINFVFISNDQSKPLDFLPNKTVIYNGINLDGLSYNATPNKNQLAFLGRITPEKGILEAIQIAKSSNKRLLIAAAIDTTQQEFYNSRIKPLLDNENIIYLGEISNKDKNKLLGTSEALLFPIKWHEPFGLVIAEAMATGTPVIANNIGSVSEIIDDNKNGFIVEDMNNISDYQAKIDELDTIDRLYCRRSVEERFNESRMVSNYLTHYSNLING